MRTYQLFFATFLLFTALFTGCGPNNSAAGETGNSNPSGDSLGGVVRQTPSPQSLETTSTSDRTKVIATRPGSGGLDVDLTGVAVTGDILTVSLRYRPKPELASGVDVEFLVEQVSITDDATSRRYGVLKDQSGQYMASPLSEEKIKFLVNSPNFYPGTYEVAWFKFPLPVQAKTISINVPKVAPFDNIRIQQ